MKKQLVFWIGLVALLTACKNDLNNAGMSTLTDEDQIVVNIDTFQVSSALKEVDYIYSVPDSFLLGECDTPFGTIRADVMAQFTCPLGFAYPENAEVDSVCVFLYYNSWHGDGNTPLSLSIYEMDRKTFSYTESYPSNIAVEDYCSLEDSTFVLAQKRIVTAASPTDSIYSSSASKYVPYVRFRANDHFAKHLFKQDDFSDQNAFNQQFKGLYITSDFGSATVLHVSQITMAVYYHFAYLKDGRDTTVSDMKSFYANSEVRQVNRIDYANTHLDELQAQSDSVNYVVSPGHIYTSMTVPMRSMSESIQADLGQKRPYINQALLKVEVLNAAPVVGETDKSTWARPAERMLLIKESSMERFFQNKELPSDTCAQLSSISTGVDSIGNTHYYYMFDVGTLLTRQLRGQQDVDSLTFVMVPVSVSTSATTSSTSISSVRPQQTISETIIRSANDPDAPMQMQVVYSGF